MLEIRKALDDLSRLNAALEGLEEQKQKTEEQIRQVFQKMQLVLGGRKVAASIGVDWRKDRIRRVPTVATGSGDNRGRPPVVCDRDELIRLRDQDGRSWKEVASKMGISAPTAIKIYRGLPSAGTRQRYKLNTAARERISLAQKLRWVRQRRSAKEATPSAELRPVEGTQQVAEGAERATQ
jgi:hypothetical protein